MPNLYLHPKRPFSFRGLALCCNCLARIRPVLAHRTPTHLPAHSPSMCVVSLILMCHRTGWCVWHNAGIWLMMRVCHDVENTSSCVAGDDVCQVLTCGSNQSVCATTRDIPNHHTQILCLSICICARSHSLTHTHAYTHTHNHTHTNTCTHADICDTKE